MMKKINAMKLAMLGAAAVAAFAITGCGGSDNKAASKPAQAESPLMHKIKSSGKLVVGTASGYGRDLQRRNNENECSGHGKKNQRFPVGRKCSANREKAG